MSANYDARRVLSPAPKRVVLRAKVEARPVARTAKAVLVVEAEGEGVVVVGQSA